MKIIRETLPQSQFEFLTDKFQQLPGFRKSYSKRDFFNSIKILTNEFIEKEIIPMRFFKDDPDYPEYIFNSMYMSHQFQEHGKKNFTIETNLLHQLFLTDITKVDDFFLELPFPCIKISLWNNEFLFYEKKLVQEIILWQENDYNIYNKKRIHHSIVTEDGCHCGMHTFEGGDILTQIEEGNKTVNSEKELVAELLLVMKLVISILLFLKTSDSTLTTVFPSTFFKKDKKPPFCRIGCKIPIQRKSQIANLSNKDLKNPDFYNILKWSVRGHFRNQPYGNKLKLKKLIWIKPTIKGRERNNPDINLPQKPYDVK